MERNRFSHEHDPVNLKMPAVIEGTLHDVYVDAFRALTGADVGGLRGFRYTNTIKPGAILMDDIYHSLSVGAMVAVGAIPSTPEAEHAADLSDESGKCIFENHSDASSANNHKMNKCHYMAWPRNLIQEIELSGNSTQQSNIPAWGGGWFWNYSGLNLDLDPYLGNFAKYGTKLRARVSRVMLVDVHGLNIKPLKDTATVNYASYYFDADYNRINRNQLVTKGSCGGTLTRACADKKIKVLAKTQKAYGAPMILVTPTQYAARSVGDTSIYPMDVVEAVGRYIGESKIIVTDWTSGTAVPVSRRDLGGAVRSKDFAPTFPRINLLQPLVNGFNEFGFGVIQPLRGAAHAITPAANKPASRGTF